MLTPTPNSTTLRVGIIRTSSLGDVVLATSCLNLLTDLPIPVEVYWVGRSASLEMIRKSWPWIKGIEIPQGSTLNALQNVAESLYHCHLIIDLQCNFRSRWLCRSLKSSKNIPFFEMPKEQLHRNRLIIEARLRGRRKPMDESVRTPPYLQYQVMFRTLLQGLRLQLPVEYLDGVEKKDFPPKLPAPDDFDPPWRKELRFGTWLAIAPGAAHPTKQAPISLLVSIITKVLAFFEPNRLDQNHQQMDHQIQPSYQASLGNEPTGKRLRGLGLVFLGDAKDREIARSIIDILGWDGPLLNLAGKLNLWENVGALKESTAMLSNDSSLGHIAEAVDTPVATLFGPTIESFGFAPRMDQSRSFSTLLGCRPCSKHGMVTCRYGDHLCFMAIDPGQVADHLINVMKTRQDTQAQLRPLSSRHKQTHERPHKDSDQGL